MSSSSLKILDTGEKEGTPGRSGATLEKTPHPPTLYVQLHGETTRRLEADEKPLQVQNDYLFQLGFGELWRVQEEGMDSEIGCLIRFYAGKEPPALIQNNKTVDSPSGSQKLTDGPEQDQPADDAMGKGSSNVHSSLGTVIDTVKPGPCTVASSFEIFLVLELTALELSVDSY
ncbi:PH domain leucine-rich repeat protein phosphatase 1 [Tupaia chinensis]|uniref:PH domain leucine-rich repeat protein phosphatase 1 n=1 Tax=Tupaia chinensis TaxID=246437 RepID=L9L826_TUPCH|nr:PH domain leucine-rich repeat protein phosphatase 1 [Tupaia chinensis]